MEKTSKFPYIMGAILVVTIGAVIAYIYFNTLNVEFPIKKFSITVGIIFTIAGIVGFVLFKLINASSEDDKDIINPKDFVSEKRALQIWKEEFMKFNNIPYMIQHWKEKEEIQPVKDDAVEFRDVVGFSDPSSQTSDNFIAFEVIVREGTKTGMVVAVTRLDFGEDWIRDNWKLPRLKWNVSMNRFNLENKKFPITSAKGYYERMNMKRIEMLDEGYTEREINEAIRPFLASQQGSAAMMQQAQPKAPPIKSADVKEAFPEYPDQEDDEADMDDLQSDIDNYRRNNK